MRAGDRWFPETASPCLRNRPGTGSCSLEGSPRIQTASVGHSIARGCHLHDKGKSMSMKWIKWAPLCAIVFVLWQIHTHTHIYLTTYLEGGLQLQQDGLTEKDLPGLEAQSADLILLQLHVLARLCSSDCDEKKSAKTMNSTLRNVTVRHTACTARHAVPFRCASVLTSDTNQQKSDDYPQK